MNGANITIVKAQPMRKKKATDIDVSSARSDKKSAEIAVYYGFKPTKTPSIHKEDVQKVRTVFDMTAARREDGGRNESVDLIIHPEEKIALLRTYLQENMQALPQPVMLYYEGEILPVGAGRRKGGNERRFHLDILGTAKSIAEATLIQTSLEILKSHGFEKLLVYVNSIGERESIVRFTRELTQFYRKHLNDVHGSCRQLFKKDPYELLSCVNEKCVTIRAEMPDPVAFLTETSREHFTEVLEYLEAAGIRYEMKKTLMYNRKLQTHTAFEIVDETTGMSLALGIRYNEAAKKLGFKRDLGAVGITIAFKKRGPDTHAFLKKIEAPKVYFIQLGFEAKLKSLRVVEILRREKVPLIQAIGKDKMIGQLQIAENLGVPYVMIMGQKEALEESVIVRDLRTHSQDTVKLDLLPKYLKKIK